MEPSSKSSSGFPKKRSPALITNPAVLDPWKRFEDVCTYETPCNLPEFQKMFSHFEPIKIGSCRSALRNNEAGSFAEPSCFDVAVPPGVDKQRFFVRHAGSPRR